MPTTVHLYMTTSVSRPVEALVQLISQRTPATKPAELDFEGAYPEVSALLGALARHKPPTALGRWELGLLDESWTRELLARSGGGELATTYDHYHCFGQHNGEVHLVLGWNTSTGTNRNHEVLEVDPEYQKIQSLGPLYIWLPALFAKLDDEQRRPLRDIFTALDAPSGADLETADNKRFEASRIRPAHAESLEAGGHMYFSVADDGTAVSVHKKGVRYLDAQGKRKAKNAKASIKYGDISPEGHAAWFLQEWGGPLYRVDLPAGSALRTFELPDAKGFAVLRDDRIVVRKECALALCRLAGDELETLHSLVSLDLGRSGVLRRAFGGRGVVVSADSLTQTWVFEIVDDQLVARRRVDGTLNDLPNVDDGVVDVDADTVLVRTKWPHGRITIVPRA